MKLCDKNFDFAILKFQLGLTANLPKQIRLRAFHKIKRDAIIAIAQTRGRGPVLKDVTLMATTSRAVIFRAGHKELAVHLGADRAVNHIEKAGPACAGVKFLIRGKKRQGAAAADISSAGFVII